MIHEDHQQTGWSSGKPLYIFDFDGTLSDPSHRHHFIAGEKKDWRGYFAACGRDEPIRSTIRTLRALVRDGAEVQIWTGRSDEVQEESLKWLSIHVGYGLPLKMRPADDHTPDVEVKRWWLRNLSISDRVRLAAVFEDRSSVVKMWREEGVTCYQVAQGDF